MKKVKRLQDIQAMRSTKAISEAYLDNLEEFFQSLYEELADQEPIEEFSLQIHGYLVILEKGDINSLKELGVNPMEDGGLLGGWPEFIESEVLADGQVVFRIGVLYDNDCMQFFYCLEGELGEEIDAWFRQYMEEQDLLLRLASPEDEDDQF